MIEIKCTNCGGQMEFGGASGFECPFCGSKKFLSDQDFQNNQEFRKMLLSYYKAEAEQKEFDYDADKRWVRNGSDSFPMEDGKTLRIEYMEKYAYSGFCCYLAQKNVVCVFDTPDGADRFTAGLHRLVFPPADVKLPRSFPSLKLEIALKNGGVALVFLRRPNFYPAAMLAPLESIHLAWVISRMENICCALEYSGIEHGDISPLSVWINPVTHEGALFGDWRKAGPRRSTKDLKDLRKTALALGSNTESPVQMHTFLHNKPADDAFDDFALWDKVIRDGFGGHKFAKM